MPNHVKNIVKLVCETHSEKMQVLESIKAQDDNIKVHSIDFNRIIPMPPSLYLEAGSNTVFGVRAYLTKINPDIEYYGGPDDKLTKEEFTKLLDSIDGKIITNRDKLSPIEEKDVEKVERLDELVKIGKQAIDNVFNYGHSTWYSWSIENWGTKWNAYDFEECGDNLCFSTAWNPCINVLRELSRQHPEITIEHMYADECLGYNTGTLVYRAGSIVMDMTLKDGSKEAFDHSMKVHGTDPELEGLYISYDGTSYVYDYCEYPVCYVKGSTCLYSEYNHSPSEIPAGFFLYYFSKDTLSTTKIDNSEGIILSKDPIELDKNGDCLLEHGDIKFTTEKLSLSEFAIHEENILSNDFDLTSSKDFHY